MDTSIAETELQGTYEPPEVLATFSRGELAAYLPNEQMPHLHTVQNS